MKNYLITLVFGLLLTTALLAGDTKILTGTIGKEKMKDDQIVICEFGTQACMMISVDPEMKAPVNGSLLTPDQWQVGWYVEATMSIDEKGNQSIKDIIIDTKKTIVCFTSLDTDEGKRLIKMLENTSGISKSLIIEKSKQVYIEYEPQVISYPKIEATIKNAGFKVE